MSWNSLVKLVLAVGTTVLLNQATAVDIQLPPETGAFKQDTGAEIANGQCLICHSESQRPYPA